MQDGNKMFTQPSLPIIFLIRPGLSLLASNDARYVEIDQKHEFIA